MSVLRYYQETGRISNLDKIGYIARLYDEEVHILARCDILSLKDLAGKRVSFGPAGSGTAMTAELLFDIENIPVEPVHMSNSEGLVALREGSIAAAVFVAGKPAPLFREISQGADFHFFGIELSKGLEEIYVDGELSHQDYPNLIPENSTVTTIAVPAVLAVYNWKENTERYERTARFTKRLFDSLKILQGDAYHPKWKEVDLGAELPGWRRFKAAEEWLAQQQGSLGDRNSD